MREKTGKGKKSLFTLIFSRLFMFFLMILVQIIIFVLVFNNVSAYFNLIYKLLNIATVFLVIYIVNEQKTDPTTKLLWAVLILVIPAFGTLLYIYVKMQFGATVLKRRIEDINEITDGYLAPISEIYAEIKEKDEDFYGICRYLYNYAGYPVYANTSVKYFSSGEEKYEELIKDLKNAKSFIFLEYFIIEKGFMWNSILKILEEKQKEGVEVRVMYDGMCSLIQLPIGYYKELVQKGIKSKPFSPMRPFVSTHQNNRDHRKIAVIDGTIAYTGGINLADEYMNIKKRFGYWKDAAVRLEGDAVQNYTLMFLRLWNLDEPVVEQFNKYIDVRMPKVDDGAYVVGYADEPFDDENVAESVYLHILNSAKKYVHIVTPYLVIDNLMMTALKFAAKRGVEVIIMMPGIPDKKYAYCVARTYYEELIEAGIMIYEYVPGFTHAKMFVSDDDVATVGTVNLDYRSLSLHFECSALIKESSEISKMEEDFQNMVKVSRKVSMLECRNRSFVYKMAGKLFRMVAPLL